MEHEEASDRLDEWLDGELDDESAAAVAAHAERCAACRADAAALRGLGRALFSPAEPRGREAFTAAVMLRLRGESAPAPRAPSWLSPALGLAFAGLLAGFLLSGVGPEDPYEGLLGGGGYAFAEDR